MENASKALIIAGAILLAILLISLGIFIFNQAQDTINNSGMSQAQVNAFNNKFIKYEGQNKKGSEVRSCIQEIISSNHDENSKNAGVSIKAIIDSITYEANDVTSSGINNTHSYTISITAYNTKGYVSEITFVDTNK